MLNDSTVLVTGGTGSFGHAFAEYVLQRFERVKLIVFSRDEMKQWDMAETFRNEKRIRFFIGDVRDRERLYRAVDDVDYVVHAAATKIVPTAEYNPFEAVKTNVNGAMNVIDACIDRGVKRVVALSTDKASSPINLYGATKLASDKMFVSANSYTGWRDSRFAVVRYGNVMGSRGSVIPFFLSQKEQGQPLRITDERMTRFMISLQEGVELVLQALESTLGGEIFVKKIPSMGIMDIAEALDPGGKREIVGIRPGEKLHEQMISSEDSYTTRDYGDHFRIFPNLDGLGYKAQDNESGTAVTAGFTYSSDTNAEQMTVDALSAWVESNRQLVGRI
ncbi:MAG: UDP-N-acetylglucosamine 4,6-dehydratase (inverting) [Cellulomonadaceae bacterium TMED98]|nr:MAG: UDP-N-acetylglucosamine 4,6-dehydratase (inverting) [Cellulomonadaceae bacterium TMED98]